MEITGKPGKDDILSIQSEVARNMLENIVVNKGKSLKSIFPKATQIELDLLSKLLQFNLNKRINVIQALEHPYLADFHEQYADTEIACEKPIKIFIDDNFKFSVQNINKSYIMIFLAGKKKSEKKWQL